jgi:hypothetical protein
MTAYEFSHNAKQRELERIASELDAQHPGFVEDDAISERSFDPAKAILISDARQSSGGDLFVSESRWFDDLNDDHHDKEIDLHPLERQVDAKLGRLRQRIEMRGYFGNDLLKPPASEGERRARIKKSFRQLGRTAASDIGAAIAATIDDDMAHLGQTFKRRRDVLAQAMECSVTTANSRVMRGQRVLQDALRQAASVKPDATDDTRPDKPTTPKRLRSNLLDATKGTEFDSEARRVAIASLSFEEQAEFVRILEHKALDGEIGAIAKGDNVDRIRMLPHCFNQVLDDVGRSDDQSRRLLARLKDAERNALCADWMHEAVDEAIGGTSEQRRAARQKYNSREYSEMVRKFVRQHAVVR